MREAQLTMSTAQDINGAKTSIGIELGSTRLKAVLIDENCRILASGTHSWENRLENGFWTYSLDDVWAGLQSCYSDLADDVAAKYGAKLEKTGSIGISAMMHGYLVFDSSGRQLVPFRTWRNTSTAQASGELTALLNYNIPQRWSIAHLYEAILNGEQHVSEIDFMTTLAGYIHWQLSGIRAVGIGDASGMFPVDSLKKDFDRNMISRFDSLISDRGFGWQLRDILPEVYSAGERCGFLSERGARLIDPSGSLVPGIPMCPPEGDAGTGMVATKSVAPGTGNISAGTSIFAMVVLKKSFSSIHPEIDMVTTPGGDPVAMVHCNNCTGEIDALAGLFGEVIELCGHSVKRDFLYEIMYRSALSGNADCSGQLVYNFFSGEPVVHLNSGRPMLVRKPDAILSLGSLMKANLFSACASLRKGMDILVVREHTQIESLTVHGGFFKTRAIGQKVMANALNCPVSIMENASEEGPWGMAVLASYMLLGKEERLCDFLENKVFKGVSIRTEIPDEAEVSLFNRYMDAFSAGLDIQKTAVARF